MGATDASGMTDEVSAELNPAGPEPDYGSQPESVPERPADGASRAKWVDYVVALGADRAFVTSDTEHHDAATGRTVTEPALGRDELIELADRLGG